MIFNMNMTMRPTNRDTVHGFTLIEIVIALAIVAIAVLAIADAMNKHTSSAAGLEKRVLASWVASTLLAELRHKSKLEKVKTGRKSDVIKMGGHRWRTKTEVEKTDVERVFLVTVTVRDDEPGNTPPYATLTSALSDSF